LNKIEKTTQFLGYEKISGLKICEIIKQSPWGVSSFILATLFFFK
jgi:hypothetical protein